MSKYWERASQKADQESANLKEEASGSKERIEQRAKERKDQATQAGGSDRSDAVGATREYPPPDRPA
jgi:hypothetical protein